MMKRVIGGVMMIGLATTSAAEVLPSQRMEDGREAYEAVCATCHDTGANGAPVTGEPGSWTGRSDLWESILLGHAESGYLAMPAKGGKADMGDYDLLAALEYMLTKSHPDLPQD